MFPKRYQGPKTNPRTLLSERAESDKNDPRDQSKNAKEDGEDAFQSFGEGPTEKDGDEADHSEHQA